MPALDQTDDRQITVVKFTGILSPKQLHDGYGPLVDFCRANDTDKILLNFTQVIPNLSTLDIYNMPRDALAAGLPRSAKLAILCAPGQVEVFGFLEVVSNNVGLNTYLFVEEQLALRWLAE